MTPTNEKSPPGSDPLARERRARLESILAQWPGVDPPPAGEPSRFAALTSEGSPEAPPPPAPTLVLASDRAALAELLRAEVEEGRLAHGRIWDLDAAFYPWGNVTMAYEVRIGGDLVRPVHAVSVEGRDRDLYLFADRLDAEAFCRAVRRRDGRPRISAEVLHDNSGADQLIDAVRGADLPPDRGPLAGRSFDPERAPAG